MRNATAIEKFYKRLGPIYNFIYSKLLFDEGRRMAVTLLSLEPGHRVLEIGVGTGLTLPLYPNSCFVTGVDVSEGMLKKAHVLTEKEGLRNVKLLQMNAREMSFPDNSFDAVLGNLFISATDDPVKAMWEMKRVCKDEGRIVLMNHFRSKNPSVAFLEKALSPISSRLGFNSNLCLNSLLENSQLQLEEEKKVNIFNLWTAASMINKK